VYEVQDWAEVHRLFHREGWAKARIAESLGMSRNTVMRLLERAEPPRYERTLVGSKLDPYRGSIAKMLDTDPKVSARVILEHLRPEGYGGGVTILKDYLQEIRPLVLGAGSYQRTSYLPGSWKATALWHTGTVVVAAGLAAATLYPYQLGSMLQRVFWTEYRSGGLPRQSGACGAVIGRTSR